MKLLQVSYYNHNCVRLFFSCSGPRTASCRQNIEITLKFQVLKSGCGWQVELLVVYSKVAILQNGGMTVWTHTDVCLCGDG
jgi:hypothetical protein